MFSLLAAAASPPIMPPGLTTPPYAGLPGVALQLLATGMLVAGACPYPSAVMGTLLRTWPVPCRVARLRSMYGKMTDLPSELDVAPCCGMLVVCLLHSTHRNQASVRCRCHGVCPFSANVCHVLMRCKTGRNAAAAGACRTHSALFKRGLQEGFAVAATFPRCTCRCPSL